MNETLTLEKLQRRWEKVLSASERAVARDPEAYLQIKTLADDIANRPLDIAEYMPTADKLVGLLKQMEGELQGTLFHYYRNNVSPTSIWHLKLLRVECRDLLASLEAFEEWRKSRRPLKIVR